MSEDYFLVSVKKRVKAQVGSENMAGISTEYYAPNADAFLRWAIENFATDVAFVKDSELEVLEDEHGDFEEIDALPARQQ